MSFDPADNSLRKRLHARLAETFGPPHATAGGGADWQLPPAGRNGATVHVIVTGSSEPLGVWIFDPYGRDKDDIVIRHQVCEAAHIDAIVESIRMRARPQE